MSELKQIAAAHQSTLDSINARYKSFYGYVPDINKSGRENALDVIAEIPTCFYFLRPRNQASHNLILRRKPPPNWRSLLGLGLNFCPRLRYTTFDLASTKARFRRDIYNKAIYADADGEREEEFDRTLYLRSNRAVQMRDIPHGLPRRLKELFGALKKIFKK